jgi:hypothetical protein
MPMQVSWVKNGGNFIAMELGGDCRPGNQRHPFAFSLEKSCGAAASNPIGWGRGVLLAL